MVNLDEYFPMYFNEKITMSEDENIDVGLATKATPKTKKPKMYKVMLLK